MINLNVWTVFFEKRNSLSNKIYNYIYIVLFLKKFNKFTKHPKFAPKSCIGLLNAYLFNKN